MIRSYPGRGQSIDVQTEVLGPTRQRMFADGAKLDRFSDAKLRPLTIPELRAKLGVPAP